MSTILSTLSMGFAVFVLVLLSGSTKLQKEVASGRHLIDPNAAVAPADAARIETDLAKVEHTHFVDVRVAVLAESTIGGMRADEYACMALSSWKVGNINPNGGIVYVVVPGRDVGTCASNDLRPYLLSAGLGPMIVLLNSAVKRTDAGVIAMNGAEGLAAILSMIEIPSRPVMMARVSKNQNKTGGSFRAPGIFVPRGRYLAAGMGAVVAGEEVADCGTA